MLEIVFSFDTTGSMSGCIAEVRRKLDDVFDKLYQMVPGIRIAVFAHSDYGQHPYVTKYVDFCDKASEVKEFVKNVESTGGGPWQECYELVLHEVRTKLSWTQGSRRVLVMIGDAAPHEPGYSGSTDTLDWQQEADRLFNDLKISIYGVQCQAEIKSVDEVENPDVFDYDENDKIMCFKFWHIVSCRHEGRHIFLEDFDVIVQLLVAVSLAEAGNRPMFEQYRHEMEVQERDAHGEIRPAQVAMFQQLENKLVTREQTTRNDNRNDDTIAAKQCWLLALVFTVAIGLFAMLLMLFGKKA